MLAMLPNSSGLRGNTVGKAAFGVRRLSEPKSLQGTCSNCEPLKKEVDARLMGGVDVLWCVWGVLGGGGGGWTQLAEGYRGQRGLGHDATMRKTRPRKGGKIFWGSQLGKR